MNKQKIVELLSDPNIDPSEWLGDALIEWINAHPVKAFKIKEARKYLISGIEENDIVELSSAVAEVFKETNDLESLKSFVDACNNLINNNVDNMSFYQGRNRSRVITRLNKICNYQTAPILAQLKNDCDYKSETETHDTIKYYSPNSILELIDNRRTLSWTKDAMINLIQFFPSERMSELIPRIWNAYRALDIDNFLNVIYTAIAKLPAKDAEKIKAFTTKERCPHLIDLNNDVPPFLTETTCRCGRILKSRPGYNLHGKMCYKNDKPPIVRVLQILEKTHTPSKPICSKCGYTFSSLSQASSHEKRCTSTYNQDFMSFREELLNKEQNDV